MQETYWQMKVRHQREVDALPIVSATKLEDLKANMRDLGLEAKEYEQLYRFGHLGSYYKREHVNNIFKTFERHEEEMKEAMKDEEFMIGAFKSELSDHEYGVSYDDTEAIRALGFTREDINNNAMLSKCLEIAKKDYMKSYDDWWDGFYE